MTFRNNLLFRRASEARQDDLEEDSGREPSARRSQADEQVPPPPRAGPDPAGHGADRSEEEQSTVLSQEKIASFLDEFRKDSVSPGDPGQASAVEDRGHEFGGESRPAIAPAEPPAQPPPPPPAHGAPAAPRDFVKREETVQAEESGARDSVYRMAQAFVMYSIKRAGAGQAPEVGEGERVVKEIRASLGRDSTLLLDATNRTQQFAISTHCVNTAIIALHMSGSLGFSEEQQARLGLAGLWHEIGVVRLPGQLIFKREQLTAEELALMRKRPEYGAEVLGGLGPQYLWLGEIVGQVYEREDGSGHPGGLLGKDIHEEAKVLAVADLFEAFIHGRPNRKALTGYQAILELTGEKCRGFSEPVTKALLKSFSMYPYNEYVLLNTGEIARVTDVNPHNLFRPVISIIYNREGERRDQPKIVSLIENPSLYVTEAIGMDALPG